MGNCCSVMASSCSLRVLLIQIIFLLAAVACYANSGSIERQEELEAKDDVVKVYANNRRRSHPGCLIWWFLPGCPLGDAFGADPFGIYPWQKFCRKYTDLEDHDLCKPWLPSRPKSFLA